MSLDEIPMQIIEAITNLHGPVAYTAIVVILLICGLGVPLPEDITLLAAGLLASAGNISLLGGIAAGFLGVLIGDAFLFNMGRLYGRKIFKLPGFRRIFTPHRVQMAEQRVLNNAHFICFIARFLPGLRSPIFALAGAMGVRPFVFYFQDGMAAVLSVPLWVYVGYWFGSNWEEALVYAKKIQFYIFAAVILAIVIYILFRYFSNKRRQQR